MYGTLIAQKKRYVEAMELTVEELLLFTEEPLDAPSIDESRVQYTTRLNKISAAKTKAIENIADIQDKIIVQNNLITELEGGTVVAPGETPKEKDVTIRRPEST